MKIKSALLSLKKSLRNYYEMIIRRKKINFVQGKKYAFVMLSATYENLGDIAITFTQINFLKNKLSKEYQIIEVPVEDTCKVYFDMKKHITESSIITLIGGGNNGDLYEFIEKRRRFILQKFKKYKIISFPQTVIYSNNNKYYKEKFIELANKCRDLTLIAREKKSFDIYKKMLPNQKVILLPDIVFYNDYNFDRKREGISLILRNDKEKLNNEEEEKNIVSYIQSIGQEYTFNDTCDISVKNGREKCYSDFIDMISKKKLVLTDRLHGMIISYITNTPCIVFENNNFKIKETYDTWLKDQNFIILADIKNSKELQNNIKNLLAIKEIKKKYVKENFKVLENILKGELENE